MKKLIVAIFVGAVVIGGSIALFPPETKSAELKGPALPSIGNHTVPNIACHEDEVIGFVNRTSQIGCVHIDSFGNSSSTVGGQAVPALHCREDELIGFHLVPNDIACVHIDWLRDNR